MKWTETTWFKHLCMAIVCIFISQSVQPMAFGFAPPQAGLVPTIAQATLPLDRLGHQVTSLMEKVSGQLQELEYLPNIQEVTAQHADDPASCASLDIPQPVSDKNSPLTSASLLKERGGTQENETELFASKKDIHSLPEDSRNDLGKLGVQWLEWLGSLLVSEAHAQTPNPNLASTPDANTTDLFIVQKAQELGNDANQILPLFETRLGMNLIVGHSEVRGEHCGVWRAMPWIKPAY